MNFALAGQKSRNKRKVFYVIFVSNRLLFSSTRLKCPLFFLGIAADVR